MIESLLERKNGSKKRKWVPNSGPGSEWIEDYLEDDMGPGTGVGYFGEVSSEDFINGDDLANLVGLTAGVSQNSNTNWLKLFIDGKVVFISKKNTRNTVSWDDLNGRNLVTGEVIIRVGKRNYRVRLLEGLGPDISGYERGSYDNPATFGSEWNRLMYPVSVDRPSFPKTSQTIDNWANFPQDSSADGLNITAGYGSHSWTQEVDPLRPTNRVFRGYTSVTYLNSNTSSYSTTSYGWRPVLELVTELLPPEEPYGFYEVQKPLFGLDEILLSPDKEEVGFIHTGIDLELIK